MSVVKKRRNFGSEVWNFMDKLSASEVCCRLCGNVYQYRTTTSSLLWHLRRQHSDVFQEGGTHGNMNASTAISASSVDNDGGTSYLVEIEPLDPSEIMTDIGSTVQQHVNSSKINKAWTLVQTISDTEVKCLICHSIFKCDSDKKNSSVLLAHMEQHPMVDLDSYTVEENMAAEALQGIMTADESINTTMGSSQTMSVGNMIKRNTNTRSRPACKGKTQKRKSVVWNFLVKTSNRQVRCLLCGALLNYRQITTNLLHHLRKNHPKELSEANSLHSNFESSQSHSDISQEKSVVHMNQSGPVDVPNGRKKKKSPVWHYMRKIAQDQIQCSLCNQTLRFLHNTTNMLTHLMNEHPKEYNEIKEISNNIKPIISARSKSFTKPHRCSSMVWGYMEKLSPRQVKCMICDTVLSYNTATSSLLAHLKFRHPSVFEDGGMQNVKESKSDSPSEVNTDIGNHPSKNDPTTINDQHIQELRSNFKKTLLHNKNTMDNLKLKGKYKENSERKQYLDRLVLEMVTLHLQPLNLLDDDGFKKFIHALDGKYALPCEQQLVQVLLPGCYSIEKDLLKLEISKCSEVALTTEIWTSRYGQNYLTVAAYYLSPSFEIKSAVLETSRLIINHTTSDIAEELYKTINAWGLEQRISCVVTDNGVDIVGAVFLLDLPHVPCYAKSLNTAIQDSMRNVSPVYDIKKVVSDTVTFFHQNSKAMQKLVNLQEAHSKEPCQLIQEVDSRWNSTYYMLERYIKLYDFIKEVLTDLEKHELIISSDEFEIIKSCIAMLKPFERATKELLTERFTPLSKVIPTTKAIKQILSRIKDQDCTHRFAEELERQMTKMFSNAEEQLLFGASTLLDPRFKKYAFSSSAAADAIEVKLTGQLEQCSIKEEIATSLPDFTSTSAGENIEDDDMLWSCFDQEMKENTIDSETTSVLGAEAQIRQLHEEGPLPRLGDPLLWWKKREYQLAKLMPMVRKYLSIPATHVPPERLFSDVGDKISQRKENLVDKAVNEILFLNERLKTSSFNGPDNPPASI